MVIIGKRFYLLSRVVTRNRYFDFILNIEFCKPLNQLVGTTGFEPATPCPPER